MCSGFGLVKPRRILAYTCLLAGLTGLALPLLPGIPLLIVGFRLLDRHDWLRARAASLLRGQRSPQ